MNIQINKEINESRIIKFDSYEEYYGSQIYPICFKTSLLGLFIVLIYIIREYFVSWPNAEFFKFLLGYSTGAVFIGLMIFAAVSPYVKKRIFWTIISGNIGVVVLSACNIFIELRLASIIQIIVYFMFGALIIAPLLDLKLFLIPNTFTNISVGILLAVKGIPLLEFTKTMLFLLSSTVFLLFILKSLRESSYKLYEAAKQNYLYSNLDILSQLLNRRSWYERSEQNCRRAIENKDKLAFIMLDIDHFKKVNDTWGHSCGDLVIKEVSRVLLKSTRETDVVGRLGGEEFGILFSVSSINEAGILAERIRHSIESMTVNYDGQNIKVTSSLGLAVGTPVTLDILIKKGDDCLYQAKNTGRNKIVSEFL